jgi:cation:H+ antiporter
VITQAAALTVVGFILSASAVVFAGVRLARHGDVIAARTRLGRLWVGSLFLAIATSLPELTTDIAAVRLGAPDLAAGDLFGSSMANMLILALLSLLPGAELFRRAALDNGLCASLAIALTATAALLVTIRPEGSVLGVGYGSLVLGVGYVAGMWAVYRNSTLAKRAVGIEEMAAGGGDPGTVAAASERPESPPLRTAVAGFVVASLVVLIAAPLFALSAKRLAELTGLAQSFVGTWLVGFATSLPELVTSLAAVRMGAYDLAVGNLFGSNAVNMVMFLPLDLAHGSQPFLASVSSVHVLSALVAIVLMAIGIASIVYRSESRFARLEPSSALMLLVYFVGLGLVYLYSGMP